MDPAAEHYTSSGITERILTALADAGLEFDSTGAAALRGVDEFHLGGHAATIEVGEALGVDANAIVLDVGCGIGGAARHLSRRYGCQVLGIDLTPAFVATAIEITSRLGMADCVTFSEGSGTDLPMNENTVDAVTVLHVGMNIEDKQTLAVEIARVLRPSGTIVVYDIMRLGPGEITYPVPWASSPTWSFVESPDVYVRALEAAGFVVDKPSNLAPLVLDVLAQTAAGPPPPANLGHLMGPDFPTMIGNLVPLVRSGTLAPMLIRATNARAAIT